MRGRTRPERLHGLFRGHAVADGPGDGEPDTAEVQQGDVDGDSPGDLPDAAEQHAVAGDPGGAPDAFRLQREPDDVAGQRPAERRTMPARGRRHTQRGPPLGLQECVGPGREPGSDAEPAGPGRRRDDSVDRREEAAAEVVEVVGVMVVGEQHGIDPAELAGPQSGAGELARRGAPPEGVPAAGRIEGRVGEEPPPVQLDQYGRPTDVREPHGQRALRSAQART